MNIKIKGNIFTNKYQYYLYIYFSALELFAWQKLTDNEQTKLIKTLKIFINSFGFF